MNDSDAIAIAERHLASLPAPSPAYHWVMTRPTRIEEGWLFEYSYECVDGTPPDQWEAFGGAPAFLVGNDGGLEDLSWGEFRRLAQSKTARE